ncbi:MAG: copper transporter [Dactylosporangium sp.]|nr:copper transporter [Dactylosporangium sp.]NNJ63895.1 copper transporter [Dactylosporangium sp.]
MINFRYHVVSLTAVFLALAIGLVVGTAAGNGPVADSLSGQVNNIHKQNRQLRDQVDDLNAEVNNQEQAWTSVAALALPGRLSGQRVLLVSIPSANKYVDNVVQLLSTAGAKVSARMLVDDKFMEPTSNDQLLDLALNAAPPGVRGALPSHSNGVETSTALLAAVLVGHGATPEDLRTVITAYESQGFLTVGADPTSADAVLFLAGGPYTEDDAAKRNAAVLKIAERFDQAGRVVVTTPTAAGEDNVVRAIRDDPDLVKTASTVDNLSTELGRLATVLALADQIGGHAGHYGFGSGATGPMPQPTGSA